MLSSGLNKLFPHFISHFLHTLDTCVCVDSSRCDISVNIQSFGKYASVVQSHNMSENLSNIFAAPALFKTSKGL